MEATASAGVSAAPPGALEPGIVLGETYRILRPLDEGGMATVFEAEHLRLRRKVAVKVLATHLAASPAAIRCFEQEAENLSQLSHPHVVHILDFAVTPDGAPYLVMELLAGETLAARLERTGRLEAGDAIRLALDVAAGLAAAHRQSIVHLDLKPANVFLVDAGDDPAFVKLLDFGISKKVGGVPKVTDQRDLWGTPDHMAPEQIVGAAGEADHYADQHALALLAYEMITGANPFAAADVFGVLNRIVSVSPEPLDRVAAGVSPAVGEVLARGLAKAPAERFASITAFAEALASAAQVPLRRGGSGRWKAPAAAGSDAPAGATAIPPHVLDRNVPAEVEAALRALTAGDVPGAVDHAEAALDRAEASHDPEDAAAVRTAAPVFEKIFEARLGALSQRVQREGRDGFQDADLSPRAAFLLSRIEGGTTIEEILEIAAMPRAEALRTLLHLSCAGLVRVGRR